MVFGLQVGISNFHLVVLDAGIREGSHHDGALIDTSFEVVLSGDGVALDGTSQESLVFLTKGLLANGLLHKLPVVVHLCVLLFHLVANLCVVHNLIILIEELLQLVGIKSAFLVAERSL